MPLNVLTEFAGGTLRTTWANSGTTASPISSALFDKSNTLVSSIAQTSSGNGFYYADLIVPNSAGNYLNKQVGVIAANTYVRWQILRVLAPEVD